MRPDSELASAHVGTPTPERELRARSEARSRRWPVGFLSALMILDFFAHDPGRMFTRTLWRDENWVAVTLRAPFGEVLKLTSTTPILFTYLLRLTPHSNPEQLRVLPLLFTVGAVIPAWLLGRELSPDRALLPAALAIAVAFSPALLARHDLKQYTAEAFVSLLLLWLLARLERSWFRGRLITLAVAITASTLLSNASMFVGPATLVGLAVAESTPRARRHLRELTVAASGTMLGSLMVFVAIDRRGDTPTLKAYWRPFYVPTNHGLASAARFVANQARAELHAVGLGPWWVVLALLIVGTITIVRAQLPALALVVPVLAVEQIGAAATHQYPLWDARTSTWFTVMLTVVCVTGLIGISDLVGEIVRLTAADPSRIPAFLAVGTVVTFGVAAVPYFGSARSAARETTPFEQTGAQVETILAGWRQGDVVVTNVDAGFGFGVYWPAQPLFVFAGARLDTFRIAYPSIDRVVVASTITSAAMADASRVAIEMARAGGGRIWVALSHWHPNERAAAFSVLTTAGTISEPAGQIGPEPVYLVTIRSSRR